MAQDRSHEPSGHIIDVEFRDYLSEVSLSRRTVLHAVICVSEYDFFVKRVRYET
jgi:hypothetical protein